MNSLQRVQALIGNQSVDHLPVQPILMMYAALHAGMSYRDYVLDGSKLAEAQLRTAGDYGIDCVQTISDPARELTDIAGDGSIDWTDSGPVINEARAALRDKATLATLEVPDPGGGGRMNDRLEAIRILRDAGRGEISIVGWIEGPLALGAELRGLSRLLEDFYEDPEFVVDLLDFTSRVGSAFWEPQVQAGADTIGMSDAAASLISPAMYERFVFPVQARVLASIKAKRPDVVARLHMCGRITHLLPQVALLPVDVFELDFPVDLALARQYLGPDRVILGNVSTVGVMLSGTPDEVYAAAAACHAACGDRHIVGTGCEVSPNTPPENLHALVAYARDHAPQSGGHR